MTTLGRRAEEVELPRRRRRAERVEEMGEVHVLTNVDEVPVIHAGAAHGVLVDPEAEPPDEVERRARRGAEARDVSGVRRDLRFDEDHVERRRERRRAEPRGVVRRAGHVSY